MTIMLGQHSFSLRKKEPLNDALVFVYDGFTGEYP